LAVLKFVSKCGVNGGISPRSFHQSFWPQSLKIAFIKIFNNIFNF
jgi:hypothetical protein